MYIHDGVDHCTRAQTLVRQLVEEHDPKYGVGSLTWSPYDTAWVSMIAKSIDGRTKWLFPLAFDHLLENQQNDGGWHTSSSDVDGILNTLAATLALAKHIAKPYQLRQPTKNDLKHRQTRAIYFLETRLLQWDVASTAASNFEILASKILHLLAREGIEFCFPQQSKLDELDRSSRARLGPSLFHNTVRSSAAQFLEGFVGDVDFDRVSQHRISGSIMASPAATAAYLMNSSTWDNEAEGYLSHILNTGSERSIGTVPSQYPTTVAEVAQPLIVLLASGFSKEELGLLHLESAANFLESCLVIDSGVIGSAPYMESEADSTARTISALCQLGRKPSPQSLIVRFETKGCFKTFTGERTTNFRTNCLVLKALLDLIPGNSGQGGQIEKLIKWVTDCWWSTTGRIEDSTNLSSNYPTMLMVDALALLVSLWAQGLAPIFDDFEWRDKVFICLYQALTRTLQDQNADGSWGRHDRCETTAYGILILTKLATFSSAPRVKGQASQAIQKARRYLIENFRPLAEPDHVWVGKISYGSSILFQAYVLAALQAPIVKHVASVESRYEMSLARIAIQTKYYARQSWFGNASEWEIQASLVESRLFLPRLRAMQFKIFPQCHLRDDRYFETIPFTWLAPNVLDRRYAGSAVVSEMMIATLLNRQLEGYVADYISEAFAGCIFEVEDVLSTVFDDTDSVSPSEDLDVLDYSTERSSICTSATASLNKIRTVFQRFVFHFLKQSRVVNADYLDQEQIRSKLLAFLLNCINGLSDKSGQPQMVKSSELETKTDCTSHSFTFAYLSCLLNQQYHGADHEVWSSFLCTPEQQYLATAVCRHLSIISFMSNNVADQSLIRKPQTPSPAKSKFSNFSTGTQRSSPVSSASSSASWCSDGDFSPISAISSQSSAPSTPNSAEDLRKHVSESTAILADQSIQVTRLVGHERRCLDVCLQSLDSTGIDRSSANLVALFVHVSELSELVFRDPNIGACYQSTTAEEIIAAACDPHSASPTPKKVSSRGSVSRARAAVTIEPLKPRRTSSEYGPALWDSCSRKASHESINTATASPLHREFNFNKPVPKPKVRRTSRSSIEMCRIERIMSTMGESVPANKDLPKAKFQDTLPNPKINPMLNSTAKIDVGVTLGESLYSLPVKQKAPPQDKDGMSPTLRLDAEAIRLAKVRRETHKAISKQTAQKLGRQRLAKQKAEEEAARQLASALQNKAMVEAARDTAADIHPALRQEGANVELQARRPSGKSDTSEQERGWVKAPPPEKTPSPSDFYLREEGTRSVGKLRRSSKLGGPRLKLPF